MDLRHVRPVKPLRFPSSNPEWDMPESGRHGRMCELMYQVLVAAVGPAHTVGADQFVYWDASSPRRCLAPDAFVKLGVPAHLPDVWRTWAQGTPELCVEILSPSDSAEKLTFAEKLRRYKALGTRELVVFNADAKAGRRLRVWDRVRDDFVERIVVNETARCTVLRAVRFVVVADAKLGETLRITQDDALVPTEVERNQARADAAERARAESERAFAELARERDALRRQLSVVKRRSKK